MEAFILKSEDDWKFIVDEVTGKVYVIQRGKDDPGIVLSDMDYMKIKFFL